MSAHGFIDPAAPRSLAAPAVRLLSRDDCQALTAKLLGFARADETRVSVSSGARGNTRFAVNQVSTAGDAYDAAVVVRSTFGRRSASASTNRLDDAALRSVVERAEALARLAPEDPEAMPELGQQQYAEGRTYADPTAALDAAGRAAAVRAVTEPARAAGLTATGFLETQTGAVAVATSRGLFAYNRRTGAAMTTTVRTPDGTGSGWAGAADQDWSRIDAAALGARAIDKARRSVNPVAVEPGRYTVVLEPTAVANLVQLLAGALGARQADEGRSFFSRPGGGTKIGQKVVDERVTLVSDPFDPEAPSAPFSGDGLPLGRTTWIENGVVKDLAYDRYWAQKNNRAANTGGGGGPGGGGAGVAAHERRHEHARADDRRHRARAARHAAVVHPPRGPAHRPLHRPHARRHVPDRAGEGHARGEEPALEREPGVPAQQPGRAGPPGARERERGRQPGGGGRGAAGPGAGLQLHEPERRGVGPGC
jgi:predicted Zn-dependent protease